VKPPPPLSTYAECVESCQLNMDAAIDRARNVDRNDLRGPQTYREALDDVKHWREMRVWYEKQVKAGRGGEQISLGTFAPPAAQTSNGGPAIASQSHWSEGREAGADDLEEAPF